jgi:hypothetical protein
MSKGLSQGSENSIVHAMRDGAYRSRPTIPLLNSVPLLLSHVCLDSDSTNRSVNNLLSRACAQPVEDIVPLMLL